MVEQVAPQSMPDGLLVTEPAPVPFFETETEICVATKVAVTDLAADMVTVQVVDEPEQAPPQVEKVAPVEAAAVSVTLAFSVKFAEQVEPQLMPEGELVTVPLPVLLTDSA